VKSKLLYIANIRLPTEKAHGLQIVQNCEAFADAGVQVELWVAQRVNTPEMKAIDDVWAHYGVKPNFTIRRLPCIDLLPLVPGRSDPLARLIFQVQQGTFILMALLRALFTRADVYYSRDALAVFAYSFVKPRGALAYEAHRMTSGRFGRWLQRQVVRRVGTVITVTARLRDDLIGLGADPARTFTAHDGIRAERFAKTPAQSEARQILGWPPEAFIVGYVGRLQTMTMDKGVGTLVEGMLGIADVALALVGGPDDMAEDFRQQWIMLGVDAHAFINAGQVAPDRVPLYLSAFDVCAMPMPWTEHFAYYASPMKLFEYMASRRAILATALPSTIEVVTDGESALLVAPGDAAAMGAAVRRLRDDPALRARLAERAYQQVMAHYTWAARAHTILSHIIP
jgi:glycosyltransferase involved in cell wall biosynthesis